MKVTLVLCCLRSVLCCLWVPILSAHALCYPCTREYIRTWSPQPGALMAERKWQRHGRGSLFTWRYYQLGLSAGETDKWALTRHTHLSHDWLLYRQLLLESSRVVAAHACVLCITQQMENNHCDGKIRKITAENTGISLYGARKITDIFYSEVSVLCRGYPDI